MVREIVLHPSQVQVNELLAIRLADFLSACPSVSAIEVFFDETFLKRAQFSSVFSIFQENVIFFVLR